MPSSHTGRHLRRLWSAEGITLILSLVQGLVVARALGPDLFGVYALAMTFSAFVYLVIDPRCGDAVIRYTVRFRTTGESDKARAIIRGGILVDATCGVAGFLLVLLLAPLASSLLHIERHASLIPVAAIGLSVLGLVATSRSVLSSFDRFATIRNRQLMVALVRTVSVCAVATGGLGLVGVIWTMSIISVVEGAVFFLAAHAAAKAQLGGPGVMSAPLTVLRGHRREIARFLAFSALTTFASSAIKQLDTLLLGAIAGPRAAGYYRLARSLTAPAGNIGMPVQAVLYPQLVRAHAAGDTATADRIVRRTFWSTGVPLALLSLLTLPLVPGGVDLVAGESFRGAVEPTRALVVGVAMSFATVHLRPLFLARDQLKSLLFFTFLTASISVAAFIPAAAANGAEGVAWARTAVLTSGSVLMALYLGRTAVARSPSQP